MPCKINVLYHLIRYCHINLLLKVQYVLSYLIKSHCILLKIRNIVFIKILLCDHMYLCFINMIMWHVFIGECKLKSFYQIWWFGIFLTEGIYLSTLKVYWNNASSFHIHGRIYHEFNKWIILWMWEDEALFTILREYLQITLIEECANMMMYKVILS